MSDQDNLVGVDTLKDHFTEEELNGMMAVPEPTPEPQPEPEPEPVTEPEPTLEPVQEPAPDSDKVSTHVPYDRFKKINDEKKLLEARLAALEAQQQSQPAPVQQPITQQQTTPQQPQISVAEQIAKIADEKVRKELGLTSEDIDQLSIIDPAKYLQYVKGVSKEEYRLETEHHQQQQVYVENVTFVNELKAIPDFPVLLQFAEKELDELPRREAKTIDDAYERVNAGRGSAKDFSVLRDFANKCKEKMTGISQAPTQGAISMPVTQPVVNPLDKAAGLPKATNLSGAKTAAMSWGQVEQLIQSGEIDKIPKDMLAQIDKRLLE